ncbi:MAG: hypothetical protein KAS32_18190 [Candidatus Peribacteraceae bacterium]|nr:hypothetical protein [Candidatus Peribacteraceae bacterium]
MSLGNQRQCSTDNCVPVSTLSERMEAYKTNCETKQEGLNVMMTNLRKWIVGFVMLAVAATATSGIAQYKADVAMEEAKSTNVLVLEMTKKLDAVLAIKEKRIVISSHQPSKKSKGGS